jgi:hypothetical protein
MYAGTDPSQMMSVVEAAVRTKHRLVIPSVTYWIRLVVGRHPDGRVERSTLNVLALVRQVGFLGVATRAVPHVGIPAGQSSVMQNDRVREANGPGANEY